MTIVPWRCATDAWPNAAVGVFAGRVGSEVRASWLFSVMMHAPDESSRPRAPAISRKTRSGAGCDRKAVERRAPKRPDATRTTPAVMNVEQRVPL
eukprot:5811949-Prymnesium_polylepis.1